MAIAAYEALLAIDREMSKADAARFVRDLVEQRPPPGEPLVPLPFAKSLWDEAATPIVSSAPMLGLKSDVAARGDAAWPVSIQFFPSAGRSAIILSVDIKPPFGSVADGWTWLRDWIAVLVADEALAWAVINGSSNKDDGGGEGLPSLSLLDAPIPAAVAPWFFLAAERVEQAGGEAGATLRDLAAASTPTGLIFTPSPDFVTPIPKAFVARFEAAAGRRVKIFQGRLP